MGMTSKPRSGLKVMAANQLLNDLWTEEASTHFIFFLEGLPVWAQARRAAAGGPREGERGLLPTLTLNSVRPSEPGS